MELLNKIQQQLKVPKSLHNKFGNYNYRSAEQILDAVKPLLGKGTLTLSDEVVMFPAEGQITHEYFDKQGNITAKQIIPATRFYVKATAQIKDGGECVSVFAFARETESRKGMDEAQVTGSTSSYARKYALNGLFGLSDVQDPDDMNNSGAGSPPPQSKPASPPPPTEAQQEAQATKEKIGQRFDQPTSRPAPTQSERQILHLLSQYWVTQIKSPNVKLDANLIMDVLWSKLGHYPSLDECTKLKDPNSPFFVPIESITIVKS